MLVLDRFTTGPERCMYLPDRQARLRYEHVARLSPQEYEARMNQGWRKFGSLLFRPVCDACAECRPLRIPVARFAPSRSQRRALRRNEALTIRLATPTVDPDRMDLYRRYHAAQAAQKGWPDEERSAASYARSFVHNPTPSVEVTAWEGDTLRAVVLADVTPNVVSGIYHYHDPDCHDRGLGTFALLQTIALARRLDKPYAYFGYYVAGCASMAYKARFRPCEILGVDGVWRTANENAAD